MIIKNTGSKIVSVGPVTILPGETQEVTDKSYVESDSLNALVSMGFISIENAPDAAQEATEAPKIEDSKDATNEPTEAHSDAEGAKKDATAAQKKK